MKFHDLPVGQAFELDGQRFTKVGPVTAAGEGGAQRFMARYVVVRPLGAVVASAPTVARKIPAKVVLAAFEEYHERCGDALRQAGLPPEKQAAAAEALEAAWAACLAALKQAEA